MFSKSQDISLEREERELNRPKNWGEITYWRLHERFGPLGEDSRARVKPLAPKKKVARALEENAVITAPLDGTRVLQELSENEQCDFFSRYNKCRSLIICDWKYISNHVLRGITITMGESLTSLDLSNSAVNVSNFEILFGRVNSLKILKISRCHSVDGACMKLISQTSHRTLTELYADGCALFRVEPLLWMSGCVGINSSKLSRLRVLDLAYTPVENPGLEGVAIGCKLLRFLNLEGCDAITDVGVVSVLFGNKKLRVLNIAGCYSVTTRSMLALAANCPELISLNASRCAKITDQGIIAIGNHCHKLQAMNVAGVRNLSEKSLFALARSCPGLLMMNLTGCEQVTLNGLRALISGMSFVVEAQTFMGFRPMDEHVEKKLSGQLSMIREDAAGKISAQYRAFVTKREETRANELLHRDKCARTIQNYVMRYMMRVHFYYIWRDKIDAQGALLIQRVYRGYRGRVRAVFIVEEKKRFLEIAPHCLLFQRIFRGQLSRKKNKFITEVVRDLYKARKREAKIAVMVRFQSLGRLYLAQKKIIAWKEMVLRRRQDECSAALVMQNLVRRALSKGVVDKMMMQHQKIEDLKHRSAARIQAFYRACKGKFNSKLSRQEMLMVRKRRTAATNLLLRTVRGYFGRQLAQKVRIQRTFVNCAAREIQRIYRGRRVIHWRDMRLNIIASFVLDRQYIERMDRLRMARMRYQTFLEDVRRDSASESPDEEEGADTKWTEGWDKKLQAPFWVNIETAETTFEEPEDPTAMQRSLIGARVKILWVAQDEWFEGYPTRYHTRKKRYRVEYDDGDHEWINLERERDRVQVQNADGSWAMLALWRPPLVQREMEKKLLKQRNADLRAEAYRDAKQWKILSDDTKSNIMFMSEITGALRSGVEDAAYWVIQDDGFGFPCFKHTATGEVAHEDPRFVSDVSEDVEQQREFVMQELRYAVYFCKDAFDKYTNAVYLKNQQKVNYQLTRISKSDKPKVLTAFLIRAKALYKQQSVVDKPMDEGIRKELEYATWLAEEFAELIDKAERRRIEMDNTRKDYINKLIKTKVNQVEYNPFE